MRKKDRHELPSLIQPQLVLSLCARFLKKGTIVLEIAVCTTKVISYYIIRISATGTGHIYIGPVSEHRSLADEREKLMDLMNRGQS